MDKREVDASKRQRSGGQQDMTTVISVVTVVRDAAATIERTLRSITGQDYAGVESIVIDGGSMDGTLEILERWRPRLTVLESGPDAGIYDAMNKGLSRCTGELICMLNADDWFAHPGVLSAAVTAYESGAATRSATAPRLIAVHGDFLLWLPWTGLVAHRTSSASTRFGMRMNHQSLFIHRDVHAAIGGYDPSCGLAADFDLVLRMQDAGTRFIHLARPVAVFSKGGSGDRRWFRFLLEVAGVMRRRRGSAASLLLLAAAACPVFGRLLLSILSRLGLPRLMHHVTAMLLHARADADLRRPWCDTRSAT